MRALATVLWGAVSAFGLCQGVGTLVLHPKGEGFSVTMPGIPFRVAQKINDSGHVYLAYKYELKRGDYVYTVCHADLGNGKLLPQQVDPFLENVIQGMLDEGKASLLQNESVKVQGFPGRIFAYVNSQNIATSGMTCWEGKRCFIITFKAPTAAMKPDRLRDFFKTFKLLPSG